MRVRVAGWTFPWPETTGSWRICRGGRASARRGDYMRIPGLRRIRRWRRRLVTPHAVARVLRRHLGDRLERLTPIQPVYASPNGLVYEASLPGRVVVFKAALYGDGTIATEAWAYERIRQLGVPVPAVLALDTSKRVFPTTYMILERVSGAPLASLQLPPDRLRPLLLRGGQYLRLIHTIQPEGYGLLDEALHLREGRIRGMHETWRPAALRRLRWGLPYLQRVGLLDRRAVDAIERLLERHDDLLVRCGTRGLLHGDFHLRHVFVNTEHDQVTGIIDFGNREVGDPIWDLAWFALREPGHLDALVAGYEPDDAVRQALPVRIPLYRFLQAFSDARKFHERRWIEKANASLRLIQSCLADEERAGRWPGSVA